MPNSLTAGEIYVIVELDPRTRLETEYCKIGIVREKDERDSHTRAKEHQTGNPRELKVSAQVKTKMVEAVETTLHHLYAPQRLSGEWFFMTATERETMLDVARDLSSRAETVASDAAKADELRRSPSSGDAIEATEEALVVYERLVQARFRSDRICELTGRINALLAADIKEKGGKTKTGALQKRKGREIFDDKGFNERYPELWEAFSETKTEVSSARFTPEKSSAGTVDEDVLELGRELEAVERLESTELKIAGAHLILLKCTAAEAMSLWEIDASENRLKVLCGTAPGIVGVCKWKREAKTKTIVDRAALKAAHPEQYAEFVSQADDVIATVIEKSHGFQH